MYLTIRAVVLRVTEYHERDALLTVLSQAHGKLTLLARGLRRKNSPLTAPCQLLAYGEFTLFEKGGRYTINEAHSVELFENLRRDLDKLSLATYFAQVAELTSLEDSPTPELQALLLNSLYALSYLNVPQLAVKAAFELRSAVLAGFGPDLSGCHICGGDTPELLNLTDGVCLCASCAARSAGEATVPVTPGVIEAMRYICCCEPKKLFSFRVGEDTLKQLSNVTERYLCAQLEHTFSALDFYKSLFAIPYGI